MGYQKPLPVPDIDTKEFWEGCKRHQLLLPKCQDCGTYRFPPGPMCPQCRSTRTQWAVASGRGKVYSWVVVHHPILPIFAPEVPYAVALIELEEGVRMASNIVDCRPQDIRADMPVEVVFEDVTSEVTLPKFRPAKEG